MKKRAFIVLIISLCTAHNERKLKHEESMNTNTAYTVRWTEVKQQGVTAADLIKTLQLKNKRVNAVLDSIMCVGALFLFNMICLKYIHWYFGCVQSYWNSGFW